MPAVCIGYRSMTTGIAACMASHLSHRLCGHGACFGICRAPWPCKRGLTDAAVLTVLSSAHWYSLQRSSSTGRSSFDRGAATAWQAQPSVNQLSDASSRLVSMQQAAASTLAAQQRQQQPQQPQPPQVQQQSPVSGMGLPPVVNRQVPHHAASSSSSSGQPRALPGQQSCVSGLADSTSSTNGLAAGSDSASDRQGG